MNLTCEIRIEDNNLFIDDELISENCATTQDIGNQVANHFERLKLKAKILKNIYSPSFETPFDKKKIKVNINHNVNTYDFTSLDGNILSLELFDNYDKYVNMVISGKGIHSVKGNKTNQFTVNIYLEDSLIIEEETLNSNELIIAVLEAIDMLADLQ